MRYRTGSTKMYYSISEVGEMTGVTAHVLRYWETEFPSLRPKKNRAGNRNYRPKDIKAILVCLRILRSSQSNPIHLFCQRLCL